MTATLEPLTEVRMTATDACRHFSAVLERAQAGETIVVTKNGQPVAQIVPTPQCGPAAPKPNGAALIAFLESWVPDPHGFSDDYLEWLDSLAEPNGRDMERMEWLDELRSTPAS